MILVLMRSGGVLVDTVSLPVCDVTHRLLYTAETPVTRSAVQMTERVAENSSDAITR